MTRFPSQEQWVAFEASLSELAAADRHQVTEGWTFAALQEHASIASFSKFSLELLAVGAPPALLKRAHTAALDEIDHARMSFRVASLCAGQPLGPGPLAVSAVAISQDLSLTASAIAAALDGCLNETLAALEAAAAADQASSEALKLVLDEIARDEQAHAELAWEYVAWAIASGGAGVREAIKVAASEALARLESEPQPAASAALGSWGLLEARGRHELRVRSTRDILRPAFARLVEG
jgi:hypothetical protein